LRNRSAIRGIADQAIEKLELKYRRSARHKQAGNCPENMEILHDYHCALWRSVFISNTSHCKGAVSSEFSTGMGNS
jgi:hypothetical protein